VKEIIEIKNIYVERSEIRSSAIAEKSKMFAHIKPPNVCQLSR